MLIYKTKIFRREKIIDNGEERKEIEEQMIQKSYTHRYTQICIHTNIHAHILLHTYTHRHTDTHTRNYSKASSSKRGLLLESVSLKIDPSSLR